MEILQVTKKETKTKLRTPLKPNTTFPQWVKEINLSSDWLSLIPIAHTDNGN